MGTIGAHLNETPHEVEIGYWIGTAFMGRGLATLAATALVKLLRQQMPDRTVIAECLPDNLPSLRVLEKAGFAQTGQPGHRPNRIKLIYKDL